MPQTVPAALVAPTKPGLTVGYLIRALNGTIATAFTTTNVAEQGTATGYYRVTDGVAAPDAGGILEWYVNNAGNAGAFLSAAAIEAMPTNFTAMAITAGGAVTAGTVSDKTGYSLSGTQSFNLTGNVTGNLSGSVGSVTGNVDGSVGSVTGAVGSVTAAVTVGTNNDKTGYSLTQAFPDNFSNLAITSTTGQVTVGSIANNAITAAAIATDAIGSDELAASAVSEIQSGLFLAASYTAPPTAAQNASQVRTELTTELGRIDATVSSRSTLTAAQIRTELTTELARIDVATSTRLAAASYTAPPTAAQNASQVRTELTTELGRIDTTVSSRSTLTAAQIRTELTTELARLDVAVSTRLATANYTSPDNAGIAAIKVKTDNLPSDPADQSLVEAAIAALPSAATIADAVWDETLSQHLAAGSTGAKLNLASTLTVGDIPAGLSAQQVWEYATRTLSVASGLTNTQETKLNELYRKAGLDPAAPVTRTLDVATGSVAEAFTGATINHVESQNATVVTSTRQ